MNPFLPPEILCQIFSFIPDYALPLRCVCQQWLDASLILSPGKPQVRPLINLAWENSYPNLLFWIIAWVIDPQEKKYLQLAKSSFVALAAKEGNLPLLQWSRENDFPSLSDEVFGWALQKSKKEVLLWMKEQNYQPSNKAKIAGHAVASGNLETVIWLDKNFNSAFDLLEVIRLAALHNDLAILRRFYFPQYCQQSELFNLALGTNNLEMLDFLRKMKCAWGPGAWKTAASGNKVKVLEWLWKNKYPLTSKSLLIDETARAGSLEALIWLFDVPFSGDQFSYPWLIRAATVSGNLKMVQWLVERGNILGEDSLCQACLSGHLEVAQWIHSQGIGWNNCPEPEFLTSTVINRNHIEIFKWMIETDFPVDWTSFTESAAQKETPQLLESFQNQLILSPRCLVRASRKGSLETIKWLVERGAPLTEKAAYQAAKRGTTFFFYLFQQGCPYEEKQCLEVFREKNITVRKGLQRH